MPASDALATAMPTAAQMHDWNTVAALHRQARAPVSNLQSARRARATAGKKEDEPHRSILLVSSLGERIWSSLPFILPAC